MVTAVGVFIFQLMLFWSSKTSFCYRVSSDAIHRGAKRIRLSADLAGGNLGIN